MSPRQQKQLGSNATTQTVWIVPPEPPDEINRFARKIDLPIPLAQLLYQRGLQTPDEVEHFLYPDRYPLHDPFLFKGMREAVERLAAALAQGERIVVYGDYDVDGQVSTALLIDALRRVGGHVHYYIPRRLEEGYGLSSDALERLAPDTDLIVTVDCGITAVEEVAYARSLGMEVIITDHHEPGPELPEAAAIIDPKQADCPYPEKSLAGCAVAFKLVQALYTRLGEGADKAFEWIDLVAVGTVADVVPLQGENRTFVWQGLPHVRSRLGFSKLLDAAGVEAKEPTAGQIGFLLAPRLNAAGRLADATPGVELLLTEDPGEAERIAHDLDKENRERRQIEQQILEEADAWVQAHADLATDRALIVAGEGWHPGVIGIVASRLVERYHRPTLVLAIDGDQAVGSGRSISGFDLHGALQTLQHMLIRFGGHQAAAGLTLATDRIEKFRQAFQAEAARCLGPDDLIPSLRIDALLTPEWVDLALVEKIGRFAPFGHGNPEPVFGLENLQVVESRGVGEGGKHWRLRVQGQTHRDSMLTGIGFHLGPNFLPHVQVGDAIRLAATLEINTWQGRTNVQLRMRDARIHARMGELQQIEAKLRRVCLPVPTPMPVGTHTAAVSGALALQSESLGDVVHTTWTDAAGRIVEVTAMDLRHDQQDPRLVAIESAAAEAHTIIVWAAGEGAGVVDSAGLPGRVEIRQNGSASRALLCVDHVPRTVPGNGKVTDDPQRTALVFWDLPDSLAALHRAVMHAGTWSDQVDVYCTFAAKRLDEAKRRLHAAYPPVEVLRQIFVAVRQRCGQGKHILDVDELAHSVTQQGGIVSPAGIHYALEVFEQAGLLSLARSEGAQTVVTMRAKPGGKVDLSSGVRYNEGEEKRAQFSHFATWVRSTSLADLIAQALQPSKSEGHPQH